MNAPYRIIPATPRDYATVERIAHATWPATFGEILTPAQIEYMLAMMYRPAAMAEQVAGGHRFHLLLERASGDRPADAYGGPGEPYAAVAYVSHQPDYLPGTTKIHKLYALPRVQGRGYGRVLVEHVRQLARAAGQSRLRLDVNYQNAAIGFYQHLGFRKVAEHTTDIGQGYLMEDWVMETEL